MHHRTFFQNPWMNWTGSSAHLSDVELAAIIEGRSSTRSVAVMQAHLADCDDCRALMIESARVVNSSAAVGRRLPWAWAAGISSVAALLVFAFLPGTIRQIAENAQSASPERIGEGSSRTVVRTLLPAENSAVQAIGIRFVWRRDDDASYRLTVTDRTGGLLWQTTTSDTSLMMPATAAVESGSTIYWYVDALRLDGSSITSGRQSFRTLPR